MESTMSESPSRLKTWREAMSSQDSQTRRALFVNKGMRSLSATFHLGDEARDAINVIQSSSSSSLVRKSMMDEKLRMEEKRQAFESTHAQAYLDTITGQDPRRLLVHAFLEHWLYQGFMMICTIVSLYLVQLEASYKLQSSETMQQLEWPLFASFAADIACRLFVYRSVFPFHMMNVFEALLIVMDLVLLSWPSRPRRASALKVLRFVRVLRILRRASSLRELHLMMMGIMASIRAVVFGCVLLFCASTVIATFAVYFVAPVCHDLHEAGEFSNCERCRTAFDTVTEANLTLFEAVLIGDNFGKLAIPLIRADPISCVILLMAWAVLSLGLLSTIARCVLR
eukprot:TRINITY_DN22902_c0_g2_i4.p1 TRINITY_DN22902_c0_g2~~TRINITY_DN22902_c0_g2_i4.p1  ORF type:complete len:341 (+),score=35.79 TRINITY_DN22902_c0_g2_i4:246-1268(+)